MSLWRRSYWHLLPERAGHTTPDAYHTVLAALLVVNLALACRDVFSGGKGATEAIELDRSRAGQA